MTKAVMNMWHFLTFDQTLIYMSQEYIQNLKEAVLLSPTNIPLRIMLTEALLLQGLNDEAENILKGNLDIDKDHFRSKFLLAKTYYNKSNFSVAMVIVEELVKLKEDAGVYFLYARLLFKEKDKAKAAQYYLTAKSLDANLSDDELEKIVRVTTVEFNSKNTDDNDADDELEGNERFKKLDKPDINFSHVGGMNKVKDDIRMKIILPQENHELFAAYGKKAGGGVLLYGPPGCGKTFLAKATAGEIKSSFITVGINEIMDMYIGQSEKNLHGLFETGRRNKPCVLFFDEVDALGASRSDMKQSAGRHVINQFLSEMDGVSATNEGVLIMGATNAPWHLDAAFRRPGRFDKIVFVPPPDEQAKQEILQLILKGKPQESIDHGKIVTYMKDFSGADIKAVVDTAVEDKLREAMAKGGICPLTTNDLVKAAKQIKPSTLEWFLTAKNYAIYANDSGIYDEILGYLKIKK